MSIQIGVNARTSSTSITNNERIFLQSSVHSNMITLKSSLNESRLWFDGDLTFGRSNTTLAFSKLDIPFASFHPNRIWLNSPMIANQEVEFKENVVMNSDVNIGQNLSVVSLNACNVEITAASPTASPIFALYDHAHTPVLYASQTGVGIGTTDPQSDFHVVGDAIYDGSLYASNISTNRVQSLNDFGTGIEFTTLSNIFLNGHVVISETLTVIGGIAQNITEVDELFVNTSLSSPSISLSNIAQNNHTIEVYHDISGEATSCNILNFSTFDGTKGASVLTLNANGALGIGTNKPLSTLDINYTIEQNTANIMTMEGVDNLARIVIDRNANVGVGTTQPLHVLHLHRPPLSIVDKKSMVALYNYSTDQKPPIFVAYSNELPRFQIGENGSTTIGDIATDSNWGLVTPSIKTLVAQPDALIANPMNGCNIQLQNSHLSNVGDYFGKNMTVTQFVSTSNLRTNFFYSENFEIPGLEVFNNANHFSINMASMIHKGSNIVFSPNESDIYRDPRVFGKVRIYAPNALNSEATVVGLNVIGPDKTISQITSDTRPIFKLIYNDTILEQTYATTMEIDKKAFRLRHIGPNTNANFLPFQVNDLGIYMYQNTLVDFNGRLGIRLGFTNDVTPILPSQPFHMKGNALFQTDANDTVLFVDGGNTRIGVGTASPSYTSHVEGTSFVRNNLITRGTASFGPTAPITPSYQVHIDGTQYTSANILAAGNIGVGTTSPQFKLDVQGGNANFTGAIFGTRIFAANNIGIGTTTALAPLDVRGNILSSSNVGIGTTNPLQSLHVHAQSFFNGNVGIGTTNALGRLHVQSGPVIFGANVGVGTTIPRFPLHVTGNLNFDGDLFQNGNRYISSQWTTTDVANVGIGIYVNSNVGIGTTLPMQGLHVTLPGYFTSTVTFDSNVNVNGLLSTRGNIASLSDQRLKTNLTTITNPMDRISHLTGYTYDRIDLGYRECGLIAQDVQKVLPEVVFSHPENKDLTISYGNLAALFVEGMKELQNKIHALEQEVAYLKAARS